MSITITINGQNAAEAVTELQDFAALFGGGQSAAAADKPKQTTRKDTAKKDENPAEPDIQKNSDAAPEESESDPVQVPSDVDLRAKAKDVGTTPGKKALIKSLLSEYGVPNITAVPDDKRVAFMEELSKIGELEDE